MLQCYFTLESMGNEGYYVIAAYVLPQFENMLYIRNSFLSDVKSCPNRVLL